MKRFIILTAIAIILAMTGAATSAGADESGIIIPDYLDMTDEEKQEFLSLVEESENPLNFDGGSADPSLYYSVGSNALSTGLGYAGMSTPATYGVYYGLMWVGYIIGESLERAGEDEAASYFPNGDQFDVKIEASGEGQDVVDIVDYVFGGAASGTMTATEIVADATATMGYNMGLSTLNNIQTLADLSMIVSGQVDSEDSLGRLGLNIVQTIPGVNSILSSLGYGNHGPAFYTLFQSQHGYSEFLRLYIHNYQPVLYDRINSSPDAYTGFDSADGGPGDDYLFDVLYSYGGEGNDTIIDATKAYGGCKFDDCSTTGDDTIIRAAKAWGGDGDDTFIDSTTANGQAGADSFFNTATANGGDDNDYIYQCTTGNGENGNDIIIGAQYSHGGDGDDYILGDERTSWEEHYGEAGKDMIFGNGGPDKIYGGDDNDILGEIVQDGVSNYIDGGSGSDALTLQLTNTLDLTVELTGSANMDLDDSYYEFVFADTTYYQPLAAVKNVEFLRIEDQSDEGAHVDMSSLAIGVEYEGDENANSVSTGSGADLLRGGEGDDILNGREGDDLIDGGNGYDELLGGSGNDLFFPGAGSDYIYGGTGSDTVSYANSEAAVTISLNADTAYQSFSGETDTLYSIEHVIGSDFDDTINGNDSANSLIGGAGDDVISGGAGDDILVGGDGHDTLTGGAGADTFIVTAAEDDDQSVTITDFNAAEGDMIKLDMESMGMSFNNDGSIKFGKTNSGYKRLRMYFNYYAGTLHMESFIDAERILIIEGVTSFDIKTVEFIDGNGNSRAADGVIISSPGVVTETLSIVTQNVGAELNHNWSRYKHSDVAQNNPSSDPAVFISAPTLNGGDGGVIRVKNIDSDGFKAKFQEWDYLNDTHSNAESFDYMTLEKGRNTMADGSVWEVGTFNLSGTGTFESIQFGEAFSSAPYLFLTIQTYNGSNAVMVRAKDISTGSFSAALFEQESKMGSGHNAETIAYVAVQPASGVQGVFDSDMGSVYFQLYSATLSDEGATIGSHQYWLKEETSSDSEVAHCNETVHVLEMDGIALIQQVTSNGGDPASIRRQ